MSSHFDPARDIEIIGGFPAAMDHAVAPDEQGGKLGSKLAINATRSFPTGTSSLPPAALVKAALASWEKAGWPAVEPALGLRRQMGPD